jgi:hypothetical protein
VVSVGSLLRMTTKVVTRRILPDVYSHLEFGEYA